MPKASACVVACLVVGACAANDSTTTEQPGVLPYTSASGSKTEPTSVTARAYRRVDLVADVDGRAPRTDADLVNPWGIATGEAGLWIADNETGVLSIFDGDGARVTHELYTSGQIELERGITGIAANATTAFEVSCSGTAAAEFIVASESGKIWGVAPDLNSAEGLVAVDNSAAGASYTGLAIVMVSGAPRLVLADFGKQRIDVYDGNWQPVDGGFVDEHLPEGYAPFNVAAIGDYVFVAYAIQDELGDEMKGVGLGLVDVFTPEGRFVRRFAAEGMLNAPWAMATAPARFGTDANMLLVGNFGDGHISAFDPTTGRMVEQLSDLQHGAIAIDGLWGFAFGDGIDAGDPNRLYVVAGTDDEAHGLYGRIEVATLP